MDAKPRAVDRIYYEDIEPQTQWATEEGFDTLIALLPGFRKEQLRVQVTSSGNLRVSGECPLGNNKRRRFHKEFSIPSNVDTNEITAKFEGGILYVKYPKVISPAEPREEAKLPAEAPKPQQKPKTEPQDQKSAQEQATQEVPSKASVDKITNGKTATQANAYNATQKSPKNEKEENDTTGKSSAASHANKVPQKAPEKEKEPSPTDEKSNTVSDAKKAFLKTPEKEKEPSDANKKKSTAAETNDIPQKTSEKERNGLLEKTEKVTDTISHKKHETLDDSVKNAAKTDKGTTASGKSRLESYKQVGGGLATELKMPKKLMNLVVAALLVLVLVLYVKNALRPIGESKSQVP